MRTIDVDGDCWKVQPAGRVTAYGNDEFGLPFELGTGPERKRRFTRYSPVGSRSRRISGLTLPLLCRSMFANSVRWPLPEHKLTYKSTAPHGGRDFQDRRLTS